VPILIKAGSAQVRRVRERIQSRNQEVRRGPHSAGRHSPLHSRTKIVDLAAKSRLPVMCGFREHVEAAGLMVYVASLRDLYRRAATYVDKILNVYFQNRSS
jgi:hypothetical protein